MLIKTQHLTDDDLAMSWSPMTRGIVFLLEHLVQNGSVKLTKTGAIGRDLSRDLSRAIRWRNRPDVYGRGVENIRKESDFSPLSKIRAKLAELGYAKQSEGSIEASNLGRSALSSPAQVFNAAVLPDIIGSFEKAEKVFARMKLPDAHSYLQRISAQGHEGLSAQKMTNELLLESHTPQQRVSRLSNAIGPQFIDPLEMYGLLENVEGRLMLPTSATYRITPLYAAVLRFETT
jgi:hypothetical protein